MKRHDQNAGGDRNLLAAKAALRERIWAAMSEPGIARFPSPDGRIPNFVGAERAAERLRETRAWQRARTVKANPDSPQLPVRQRALEDGKLLYMAVPRLADEQPFFLLDPDRLVDPPRKAVSIKGASRSARTVGIEELEAVDLVVAGCVAVGEDGARLGKGGGFSDLEYAVAAEAGLIGPRTTVVTTVHDTQVVPAGALPTTAHDMHVDLIATPTQILECPRGRGRPRARLRWEELTEDKIRAVPILARLRDR
jgi:5-formyltetrahydrofolate cyclo-ligase